MDIAATELRLLSLSDNHLFRYADADTSPLRGLIQADLAFQLPLCLFVLLCIRKKSSSIL